MLIHRWESDKLVLFPIFENAGPETFRARMRSNFHF